MVAVYGRMLTRPLVQYNNGTASAATGGWNLLGRKFQISGPKINDRLEKWGSLRIVGPRSAGVDKYRTAIYQLRGNFETCGIPTSEPSHNNVNYHNAKEDFNSLRMENVIRDMHTRHSLDILLVILPIKDTALYNRIKKFCDRIEGIQTVCVVEDKFFNVNGTYLANVALKFNLKLGGTNHTLNAVDRGIISQGKTMVIGIDVVHPSPGSGKASVASMVASIHENLAQWPVDLRVQVREGQEMLDKIDLMLESRLALWLKHKKAYPENILIYRDGVSETQYQQVLDQELKCMRNVSRKVYNQAGQPWPRFTLIVVGKRHHTRFFPPKGHPHADTNGNPNRGLVVDRTITEARNWDFFLQSHDAIKGTARPAHYYVLWDEIFTNIELESEHNSVEPGVLPADRLERVTHSLCYMFSRATKAVSIPAPVYYADIACARAGRYLAEVPSGSASATTDSSTMTAGERARLCAELQEKIAVHKDLRDSMFYV